MNRLPIARFTHVADRAASRWQLLEQFAAGARTVAPRQDILAEGQSPKDVHLIVEGWACRYKHLPSGRRAITAFLLPGDFCDLHVPLLGQMHHSIGALTRCNLVRIGHAVLDDLIHEHPDIARMLWRSIFIDQSILREWLVNMGQRSSEQQMAHLFCELRVRLSAIGRVRENSYHLPVTQEELGDALGLSAVHVNRILQHLREERLIALHERRLTVPDLPRLERFAEFNAAYLGHSESTESD